MKSTGPLSLVGLGKAVGKMTKTRFSGWSVMVGCFLLFFCGAGLISNTAGLFMNPICEELHVSTTSYSLINVFTSCSNALASAFLVSRLHTGNMKKILLLAILVTCGGYALQGFCHEVWQLWIVGFVLNLGMAFLTYVPVGMMITNWFIDKRSIAMSVAMSGMGVGGAIWSVVMAKCIEVNGWRSAYFIGAAVTCVALILVLVFLLKKSPEQYGQTPYVQRSTEIGSSGAEKAADMVQWQGLEKKAALKTGAFALLAAAMLLVGLYAAGVATHVVTFLVWEGWDLVAAGGILSVQMAVSIAGMLLGGVLINRFGLKLCVLGAGIVMAVSCLSLALTPQAAPLAYLYGICAGFAGMMASVVPSLMVSSVFGVKAYTGIYSSINVFFMLGCAVGSAAVALVSNAWGYVTAWYLCTAACLLVIVFFLTALNMSEKFRKLYPNPMV